MAMDSKTRAELRKQANTLDAIYQVGKEGIDKNLITGVGQALKARELIKLQVQRSSPIGAKQAAEELAEHLGADVVQVIGSKFVLYKENKDKQKDKKAAAKPRQSGVGRW